MLDVTKKLISSDELLIYNDELKKYIESKELFTGLTEDDVQTMIDASDNSIKISEDNNYEPLETEENNDI